MNPPADPPTAAAKPDYGVDAPGIIRGFFVAAAGFIAAAFLLRALWTGPLIATVIIGVLLAVGAVCLTLGSCMVAYGLRGKFRMRDFMLGKIAWRGDETVLDVGTGRGLLAVGAAKRLTSGKVIGIDIWNAADLSDNRRDAAEDNATGEEVAEKVELLEADACTMPFADNTFEVVVSLLCLHNIEPEAERAAACREIARVLKPGGTALIADYVPTHHYAQEFTRAGLTVRETRPYFAVAYGLMWMTEAAKA